MELYRLSFLPILRSVLYFVNLLILKLGRLIIPIAAVLNALLTGFGLPANGALPERKQRLRTFLSLARVA